MDTFFKFATPIVYWILIIVWALISIFYFKKIRLLKGYSNFLKLLLIILAIDAARSFFESLYFGAWYTSYSGLLPISIYNFLANPKIVFIPKIINLIIAILILFLIIKKWLEYELIEINTTFSKQGFENKKLSVAVNQSANSIIITDIKGNIEYTNPKFTEITGYSSEEAFGKNPRILNSGEQSKEFYDNMWRIISVGEIWSGELKNKKKNGEFYWEEVTISPVKNDAGKIINYLAIKKDISTLKENEKRLIEQNEELHLLSSELQEKNSLLFNSKNKFKNLFDKSPVSIWEQDFSEAIALLNKKKAETGDIETYLHDNPEFVMKCVSKIKVLNVNDITLELIGVKNVEELRSHLRRTNTKEVFNELKNELISIALGKKDYFGETKFRRTDGTILHTIVKSTMIDDNGGNIASIINITERKKAEEELMSLNKELEAIKNKALEGEESYKTLFKSIGDAIYIQDYEAKFIDVNSSVLNMYGYSKEDFIGNTPLFLSAPDMNDMSAVFESFDKVKQGTSQVFEFWGKRKNGEIFPKTVEQYKGTYFGQDVVITVARDISNQFKTQQELIIAKEKAEENEKQIIKAKGVVEISEKAYKDVVETSSDLISVVDRKGKILFINHASKKFYGLPPKECLGKLAFEFILPEDKEYTQTKFIEWVNSENDNFHLENRQINATGEIFDVEWNINIERKGKEVIKITSIGRDITEQNITQQELIIAKEKAEENEVLKSAFLANMSHEIRTPMNSILGFSELLMNEELTPDKKDRYHEIVHNNGKRLMNLISDIVDISKIDTKQLTINYSVFNLNTLLDNLQSQFEISPLCKNITYKTSKGLTPDRSYIRTDNNRLVQVLSNLIENALKFTDKGFIEIGYTTNDSEFQFFIKDSGVGINKKDLNLIFERFGQSNNQYQKAKEGTGLGLSISKGIIEMLGGKIWVESELHMGSTFFFTIPNCNVENDELKKVKKSTVKIVPKISPTILIAEDEESNYWLIEAILEKYDFKLLHAKNGKEAVEMFQNNEVDLILMDFNMPIMSGIEATELIRQTNKEIPIIALTAYAMAEDKERATKVGCNDFISKPVKRNVLLEVINHNLKAIKKV